MDLFALGLKIETVGFQDATARLREIDQIGRKIAGNATTNFGIVGGEASKAATMVNQTFSTASTAVHGHFERIAHKATAVGSGIAAAGQVGASGLERIAHAAGNVALMFGPEGAIVSAAAIAAIAIVGVFHRAQKEMEETDRKARELLRGLSVDSGVELQRMMLQGDEFARAGSPEAMGITKAKAKLATLPATKTIYGQSGLPVEVRNAERDEIEDWLKKVEPLYARVNKRTWDLAMSSGALQKIQFDLAQSEKAAEKAILDRSKAETEAARVLAARQADATFQLRGGPMRLLDEINARVNEKHVLLTPEEQMQASVQAELKARVKGATPLTIRGTFADDTNGITDGLKANLQKQADQMRQVIASTFGSAIVDGFRAAFSGKGIGGAFKALGKSILQGLGSIFIQMGEKMVAASALMQAFQKALASFIPGGGLVAGLALIALGAGMSAMGGSSVGGGGGAAGGGYGAYGASRTDDITKIRLMPGYGADQGGKVTAMSPTVNNFTVIGQNDPVAQRQIVEMVTRGQRRGI